MNPEELVTVKEVTSVITAVGIDNYWRRGRRDFLIIKKDLFGLPMEVRNKDNIKLSLKASEWHIRLDSTRNIFGNTVNTNEYDLPVCLNWPKVKDVHWGTYIIYKKPLFEIASEEAFIRDWTLLKMFSSEFEDEN